MSVFEYELGEIIDYIANIYRWGYYSGFGYLQSEYVEQRRRLKGVKYQLSKTVYIPFFYRTPLKHHKTSIGR